MNISGRKLGLIMVATLINLSTLPSAWSQLKTYGPQQLQKDISHVNSFSHDFNIQPNAPARVNSLVTAMESFLGREFSAAEKKFLTLQLASMTMLPNFVIKNRTIEVTNVDPSDKLPPLSIEVVSAEKSIFKYGSHTFQVDPDKSLQDNVQMVLREFHKVDDASPN